MAWKRIQLKQYAALLYEVTTIDSKCSFSGLVNAIFTRWWTLQLFFWQIKRVNCRINHVISFTKRKDTQPATKFMNSQIKAKNRGNHRTWVSNHLCYLQNSVDQIQTQRGPQLIANLRKLIQKKCKCTKHSSRKCKLPHSPKIIQSRCDHFIVN